MRIEEGRNVALVVTEAWYASVAQFKLLSMTHHNPNRGVDMFSGRIVDSDGIHGIWVKPNAPYSRYPEGSLFVPWSHVVAAMLLGKDEEAELKKFGFSADAANA